MLGIVGVRSAGRLHHVWRSDPLGHTEIHVLSSRGQGGEC